MVTYQGKAYNPSYYSPQQNYGYQSYNQYDKSAAQRNYQSNSRPVARFTALPPPVQVVTSQPTRQSNNNVRGARPHQEKFKSEAILMTYIELYPKLVQGGLLSLVDISPLQSPYPRWYNENVHYDYHSNNRGHFTKNYTALKRKVQDLIKIGELTFEDKDIPNVNENPLSNHRGPRVNAMKNDQEMQVKRNVQDVRMPIKLVHEVLAKAGRLEGCQRKKEEAKDQEKCFCQYHGSTTDHAIQKCQDFLELIQEIMNKGELEFYGKIKEQNVSVFLKEEASKPLTIFY